ncbi:PTS sugar transporter subunit IIB [Providencia burhodogranariea]|uniref:PTS system, mannose-specific IIAB component n=1 Tax=Providencia burhodogranariea DSM 19968 TaxID=1141662 RepID=K8WMJ8_9GAMM|nr:PTS sugar transporter subunit IIB [Providencia burhodogranariea]EKT61828.1 PTS system, mannose-specific IIAB component [Providencia burhodogranariea DSM 19968]
MSNISLLRIDDRLIHGQVMTGWVKHLNASKIIIIDNELVNDDFMISVLEMAVPSHMQLNIYSVDNAVSILKNIQNDGRDDQIIILVKSPLPVWELIKQDVNFDTLTVGGMGVNENRTKLYRNLAASQSEREAFREISKTGLPILIQVIPNDNPSDLLQHL